MSWHLRPSVQWPLLVLFAVGATGLTLRSTVVGEEPAKKSPAVMACAAPSNDFENEVWTKIGAAKCLTCHRKGGDAGESAFVLTDLNRTELTARGEAMQSNRAAFARMAAVKEGDQSRMLLKVVGQLEHGGGEVLKRDSSGYRVLEEFVRRANAKENDGVAGSGAASRSPGVSPKAAPTPATQAGADSSTSYFEGVVMLDDRRLLRRATLSLAGRLPTEAEFAAVGQGSSNEWHAMRASEGRGDSPRPSKTQGVPHDQVSASDSKNPSPPAPLPAEPGRGEEEAERDGSSATSPDAASTPRPSKTQGVPHDEREKVLASILDAVMKEDAFYDRLREGYNDIFLTLGIDGNADATVLAYEHFEKTRLWYQKHDLSHIADEKERRQAGYKLANDYRAALLGEPMKLVEYIVRNDRSFTEIVTADYIMVTPFSARGYGVFDELKDQFKNPDDPFEYVPVKLKALVGRNKSENQDSETGFYPHAGLLSTFQYLTRYPTTETNRNRLRARMYYQHFLGVDVLELAARVSDAAAATAKYKVPTMEAAECVVCHKTLDPVAGMFQDYWRFDANFATYGKRKGGWFDDMFAAGYEGEDLPADQRWRSLQWLGERTAKDPRFAVAMTEHVYYILTGRKVLLPPKDFDDPLFPARQRAYAEQRRLTEAIAARFAASGFNLKEAFKGWILSDFYRADGLATVLAEPCRRAELDDVGLMRLLSPEQIERKVGAVFGQKWGRLHEQLATLYGGIDSKEVTDRATDPSGAMGSIQRTLSNDVACRHVNRDFNRPANERLLFPHIEPDILPGASMEGDLAIQKTAVHLHDRILGRHDVPDSPEIERTVRLFKTIVQEASQQQGLDKRETYHCRTNRDNPGSSSDDPHYTIRSWRAVITYLLRRPEFLYE